MAPIKRTEQDLWPAAEQPGRRSLRPFVERRRHGRIALDEPASLQTSYDEAQGIVVDLSSGGAAVRLGCGLLPGLGEEIAIKLLDRRHMWGRVKWLRGDLIGIEFPAAIEHVEELAWPENREVGVYLGRKAAR